MNNTEPEKKIVNPNRTRDHLANERTYLAWIRTAIALMGFGVVIVRLRTVAPPVHSTGQGWRLGLLFDVVGLLMVVFATTHYFNVLNSIEKEIFEPKKRGILLCSLVIVLVGAAVIFYLLSNEPIATGAV